MYRIHSCTQYANWIENVGYFPLISLLIKIHNSFRIFHTKKMKSFFVIENIIREVYYIKKLKIVLPKINLFLYILWTSIYDDVSVLKRVLHTGTL